MAMVVEEFGVSAITARRDFSVLEEQGELLRTHGGAMLPGFARHEDSFHYRLDRARDAKERLASRTVELIGVDEVVFIDSSTTAYHVARRILQGGSKTTLVSNLVPVMDLFSSLEAPNAELVGVGGSLRKLTLSFVGPYALQTIRAHFAEKAVISVKGVTPDGYLTDPDVLEAEVKRAMIERSEESLVLLEGEKLTQRGLNAVGHVSQISRVLVADGDPERVAALEQLGGEMLTV